eukprot:365982-Chlamydomonas_euryale.AAC.6
MSQSMLSYPSSLPLPSRPRPSPPPLSLFSPASEDNNSPSRSSLHQSASTFFRLRAQWRASGPGGAGSMRAPVLPPWQTGLHGTCILGVSGVLYVRIRTSSRTVHTVRAGEALRLPPVVLWVPQYRTCPARCGFHTMDRAPPQQVCATAYERSRVGLFGHEAAHVQRRLPKAVIRRTKKTFPLKVAGG